MKLILQPNEITYYSGHAYSVRLPNSIGFDDSNDEPTKSTLLLYENDKMLGPAHRDHQSIVNFGKGAYSHWDQGLIFSSLDNSNPITNERTYSVRSVTPLEMRRITLDQFTDYFYPKIVGIETINTCNARCPFCPLFQGDAQMSRDLRPATIMSQDVFDSILSQIVSWPIRPDTIFLNMNGEPLQDPKIVDRFSSLKKQGLGHLAYIQTNGHFLDEAKSRALLEAGIAEIVLGFDGATKETYEMHRVRCNYERVLGNIRRFCEIRKELEGQTRIAVKYVRTKKNRYEIKETYGLFRTFLDPALDRFEDTLSVDWGDMPDGDPMFFVGKVQTGSEPVGCGVFNDQMIVLADGIVAACCWDYNLTVSDGGFGKISEANLLEIWRSAKRIDLLHKLFSGSTEGLPEKCKTCSNLYDVYDTLDAEPAITDRRMKKTFYGFSYSFS